MIEPPMISMVDQIRVDAYNVLTKLKEDLPWGEYCHIYGYVKFLEAGCEIADDTYRLTKRRKQQIE